MLKPSLFSLRKRERKKNRTRRSRRKRRYRGVGGAPTGPGGAEPNTKQSDRLHFFIYILISNFTSVSFIERGKCVFNADEGVHTSTVNPPPKKTLNKNS